MEKIADKKTNPGFENIPLDRISRSGEFWVTAAARLSRAGLIPNPIPEGYKLELFIRAAEAPR